MNPVLLLIGLVCCYAALAVLILLVLSPARVRVSAARRGRKAAEGSPFSGLATRAVSAVEKFLAKRRQSPILAGQLEAAGLTMRPAELVVVVVCGAAAGGALGLLLAGPVAALVLAAAAPVGAKVYLHFRATRRRSAFADQLDDSLQMMASALRAGHSLLRAVDAVAAEAPSPTSEELRRVINETRLGRDLGDSLEDTAARMGSQDFSWVRQAIDIHREVGGNLAEVLDQVGNTIRERNQLRGQVKALSAEGRISAIVLMVLPFGLSAFLFFSSPGYINKFTQSPIGYMLLVTAGILLVAGAMWLRKVVTLKF